MSNLLSPSIIGFAANSGTGKTTLISQLIPILNERGLKVGLIKHSHHDFDIDQPGKDSYRLREAGASPVVLVSKHRRAVISELATVEPTLAEQLHCFPAGSVDLVIVEGFKHENFPKIELYRTELNQLTLLHTNDPSIIAIASNANTSYSIPSLDLNNPEQITDFIIDHIQTYHHD